jgi:hypothetical protein
MSMRTSHMQLLNEWRNAVVRDADRMYVGKDGRKFNMSLSNDLPGVPQRQGRNSATSAIPTWRSAALLLGLPLDNPGRRVSDGREQRRQFLKIAGLTAAGD